VAASLQDAHSGAQFHQRRGLRHTSPRQILNTPGDGGLVTVETAEPTEALHRLTGWALGRGVSLDGITVERPSLEDVYLRLTGPLKKASGR
jgi:hypothetical protein